MAQIQKIPAGFRKLYSFMLVFTTTTLLLMAHNELIVKTSEAVVVHKEYYRINSITTLAALSILYLVPGFLLFYFLLWLFRDRKTGKGFIYLLGIVSCLVPLIGLAFATYGFDLHDPFLPVELVVFTISGMIIAFLENRYLAKLAG